MRSEHVVEGLEWQGHGVEGLKQPVVPCHGEDGSHMEGMASESGAQVGEQSKG